MDLLELVIGLPGLVIMAFVHVWEFLKQPTADKLGQIAFGCLYITLAIILSPCACAIWIIQAIAS